MTTDQHIDGMRFFRWRSALRQRRFDANGYWLLGTLWVQGGGKVT